MRSAYGPLGIAYGLATSGALLTCFAVVFNAGPFAKAAKPELPTIADRTIESLRTVEAASIPQADDGKKSEPSPVIAVAARAVETPEPATEAPSPLDPGAASADAGAASHDPAPHPVAATQASIVGIWAPDTGACSVGAFRGGLLPTIINAEGAWAGETFCVFKKLDQTQSGWTVTANCSNRNERWTTRVRLTVKGQRLIWASKRGTQAYTRCPPDVLIAQAR
jgi:hypothetical protein